MRIAPAAVLALSLLAAQPPTPPAPDATGQAGDAAILQSLKGKASSLLLLRGEEQRVAYGNIELSSTVNGCWPAIACGTMARNLPSEVTS